MATPSELRFEPSSPVYNAIQVANNNIRGINLLEFNDPGPSEGLNWRSTQAKVYVSPLDNSHGDGYLRVINDDGITLEPDSNSDGLGHVLVPQGDVVVRTGQIRLEGVAGSDGLDLNNRNLLGANRIQFADPGTGEGIQWRGTNAEIVVSPLGGGNADGYLRLINDDGISLESNTRIQGRLEVSNGVLVSSGDLNVSAGRLTFGGAQGRTAIELGNRNFTGVNRIILNDPGVNEGISWSGSQANIFVAPLAGGNGDGYLRITNDDGISLESDTLVTGALTVRGTTTLQGDMNLQGGISAPVGTFTTANITNATIANLNGNTRSNGTLTIAGTLAVNGEVRLGANNRFVGTLNTGTVHAQGDLVTWRNMSARGNLTGHSLTTTGGGVTSRGGVTAGTFVRAGTQGIYVGNNHIVTAGRLLVRQHTPVQRVGSWQGRTRQDAQSV